MLPDEWLCHDLEQYFLGLVTLMFRKIGSLFLVIFMTALYLDLLLCTFWTRFLSLKITRAARARAVLECIMGGLCTVACAKSFLSFVYTRVSKKVMKITIIHLYHFICLNVMGISSTTPLFWQWFTLLQDIFLTYHSEEIQNHVCDLRLFYAEVSD